VRENNERIVALTFDDGPNPPYTSKILDVLEQEHVHATFFLVGRAVAAHPDVARRLENCALLLRKMGCRKAATPLEARH